MNVVIYIIEITEIDFSFAHNCRTQLEFQDTDFLVKIRGRKIKIYWIYKKKKGIQIKILHAEPVKNATPIF